jgi:hypothetical protein
VFLAALGCFSAAAQTRNYEGICDAYEQLADAGDLNAQTQLAYYCYLRGNGRPRDVAKAVALLEQAAGKGVPTAQVSLATILLFEAPDPTRFHEARVMLEQAAAVGYQKAHFPLAMTYHQGLGIPKDDATALEQLEQGRAAGEVLPAFLIFAADSQGLFGKRPDRKAAMEALAAFDGLIKRSRAVDRSAYLDALARDETTFRFTGEKDAIIKAVTVAKSTETDSNEAELKAK